VPTVLVVVFALPLPVRRGLALAYTEPTLLTAFAAHFVHLDAAHLATNLAVYALVVPVVYLLCVLSGRRTGFLVALVTFAFAFPLGLSVLNVALVRPRLGYGFSGVNAAFFGFLPVVLFGYLPARLDAGVEPRDSPALFFASAATVAVVAVPLSPVSLALAAVCAFAAAAYLRDCYPGSTALRRRLVASIHAHPGYVELAVVGAGLFASFPFAAFPADAVGADYVVNLYAHVLGYALGFVVSYVTFALVGLDDGEALPRSKIPTVKTTHGPTRNVGGRAARNATEPTDE
jgi:hypothetical protein